MGFLRNEKFQVAVTRGSGRGGEEQGWRAVGPYCQSLGTEMTPSTQGPSVGGPKGHSFTLQGAPAGSMMAQAHRHSGFQLSLRMGQQ